MCPETRVADRTLIPKSQYQKFAVPTSQYQGLIEFGVFGDSCGSKERGRRRGNPLWERVGARLSRGGNLA